MLSLFSTIVLTLVALQTAPSSSQPAATAQSQQAGNARKMTLVLPHSLREGEAAWLLVKVGDIGHKQIRLTTQDGRPLGTISPFAIRSGQAAGTYSIPVPAEDFHHERLALRLSMVEAGDAQRAPTKEELESVRLVIRPVQKAPR
jgi:hypothetical protein